MNVLVTNAKNRIAYNVVKSLSARGHRVFCADFVPRAMTYYSRCSSGHFIYPSPFSKQDEFVDCLINNIDELKIDILIPVFEETFLVAKHKKFFSQYVNLAIPDYEQILIAHNKDQWESVARQIDIPVPETFSVDQLKNEPTLINQIVFPLLLKPKQGGGGWGIGQINTAAELKTVLESGHFQNIPLDRYIVQQKIQGETICIAMVFCNGELRGKTAYRQVREYPPFGGQATCRVSISNILAEDYLQKLLEHLGWHGVCQVDFVVEKKTGIPYLIDVNPRFWGSLVQGIASGVDYPYLVSEIAAHGDVQPVNGFNVGVQTRWLGGELRGFYEHLSQAKRKGSYLYDFFRPETTTACFDDFSLKDPLPFGVWCLDTLYRLIKFKGNKPHESLEGIWD